MMKKVIICLLFLIILHGANSYGEGLNDVIYCDGSTLTLEEAVQLANENDTIYITNSFTISSSIYIDKPLTIQSQGEEKHTITIGTNADIAFVLLSNMPSFTLENISIKSNSLDKLLMEGVAQNTSIKNCKIEKSHIIINGGEDLNMEITDSTFIDAKLSIRPNGENNLLLKNNVFDVMHKRTEGIIIENTGLEVVENMISNYTFAIGDTAMGDIHNNTFDGISSIKINTEGSNLHFNHNNIYKKESEEVSYIGDSVLDFKNNWWGTHKGPQLQMIGNVDYSNWALYEDYSRYHEDPYTLEDLEVASSKLGQGAADNWLYNIKDDNIIDLLDLIGIARRIER